MFLLSWSQNVSYLPSQFDSLPPQGLLAAQSGSSGFGWDPLSFAFTAAIGLLAVIVPGLLSSGPGRLKASKAAIGVPAGKTNTQFHRDEFQYRTTLMVPFIRELWRLKATENIGSKIRMYPARWVTLLEIARLSLSLDGIETVGGSQLVEVVIDHLPSDVTATPCLGHFQECGHTRMYGRLQRCHKR
ncbi:uncharacterized protein RAG0_04689 [Rhynchosporium agropyri]|uniref:Uncharacterized protein n=1 Tax=Rhynchosporium agropyri TaxID=914238 RepID=A0A1E1KA87_9HELO|nr:uncharacterized protein RAG0_04689 [Rhynchosporium agropyri]